MRNGLRNRDLILAAIAGFAMWLIKMGLTIGMMILCVYLTMGSTWASDYELKKDTDKPDTQIQGYSNIRMLNHKFNWEIHSPTKIRFQYEIELEKGTFNPPNNPDQINDISLAITDVYSNPKHSYLPEWVEGNKLYFDDFITLNEAPEQKQQEIIFGFRELKDRWIKNPENKVVRFYEYVDYTFTGDRPEHNSPNPYPLPNNGGVNNTGWIIGIVLLTTTTLTGLGYIIYDNFKYNETSIKDTIKKMKGKK